MTWALEQVGAARAHGQVGVPLVVRVLEQAMERWAVGRAGCSAGE
jgi:hypothetical protein